MISKRMHSSVFTPFMEHQYYCDAYGVESDDDEFSITVLNVQSR